MTPDEAAVCMDLLLGCKSESVALTREQVKVMLRTLLCGRCRNARGPCDCARGQTRHDECDPACWCEAILSPAETPTAAPASRTP